MLDYEPVSGEAFEALRTSARASQASVEPSPMVPSAATRTILTVFKAAESVFLIHFSLPNKLKRELEGLITSHQRQSSHYILQALHLFIKILYSDGP